MGVDVGIFYVAKSELQRSADAAALAAAGAIQQGSNSTTASQQAVSYAQANLIGGQTLATSAITITYGGWQSNAFVAGATPVTAVQVRLNRTSAAGNAVQLYFGQFVGISTIDIQAVSIARIRPQVPQYNLVGINEASFGSLGILAGINGRFVGNGNVSVGCPLGLLVSVNGDARSWGGTTKRGALACVSGSTAPLSDQLVYPSVTIPTTNDNAKIAAYLDTANNFTAIVGASIPAGTYVVRDFNLIAGLAVDLQGPVTFYVTNNANIAAAVNLLGNSSFSAENFKVRVAPGGCVNFLAPILVPLNMDMYAPDSNINVAVGISAYTGRLIGKTLDICLPVAGSFTEERDLSDPINPGAVISIVK